MPDLKHGSSSTYTNHKCRCKLCKAAWAEFNKTRRAERSNVPLPEGREHGVYTTYANYGCRCDPCKAENARLGRERTRKKNEADNPEGYSKQE